MPISDTYVVQYLLQISLSDEQQIAWREKESGGYEAIVNGVELELDCLPSRMGSRICISLASLSEKVHIEEPLKMGLFQDKYENEDQRRLVHLLKELSRAVAVQCSARRRRSAAMAEVIRQTMYRRLIGASEPEE
jgi:hypothetical protein